MKQINPVNYILKNLTYLNSTIAIVNPKLREVAGVGRGEEPAGVSDEGGQAGNGDAREQRRRGAVDHDQPRAEPRPCSTGAVANRLLLLKDPSRQLHRRTSDHRIGPDSRGDDGGRADVLAGLADLAAREDRRQQLEHLRGNRVHRAVDIDIEEPARTKSVSAFNETVARPISERCGVRC